MTLHLAATLFLAGLIWSVQIVIYPLFARVGETFTDYHREYTERITWIVAPAMGAELVTGVWWAWTSKGVASTMGLALLAVLWLSTALIQVPLHNRLSREDRSLELVQRLVSTNWLRTICWTARAILVLLFAG